MFKVGDEVIVKTVQELLEDGCTIKTSDGGNYIEPPSQFYLFCVIEEMVQFCGRRFYIKSVGSDEYTLVDDNGNSIKFLWEDYMLKSAEEKSFDIASKSDIAGLYD